MDGWLNAQFHHYGTSYSGGAYGAPPYDPEPPICPDCCREYCICPSVDTDEDVYLNAWRGGAFDDALLAEAVAHD